MKELCAPGARYLLDTFDYDPTKYPGMKIYVDACTRKLILNWPSCCVLQIRTLPIAYTVVYMYMNRVTSLLLVGPPHYVSEDVIQQLYGNSFCIILFPIAVATPYQL